MRPILDVVEVSKFYGGVIALDAVSLSIDAGEIVALAGPNGAGKSTLFSIIAGVVRPDSGTVVLGHRADGITQVGFAPQNIGLYLTMTVRENLAGFGALEGLHRGALKKAIEFATECLDLHQLLDQPVRELSSGEQRRAHVAVAVLHRPALLLLDEPTAGVDVASRERLLRMVRQAADQGSAVCYSTHYLTELETIADRVVQLHNGCVSQELTLATLLEADCRRTITFGFDGVPPSPFPTPGRPDSLTVVGHQVEVVSADPASTIRTALAMLGPDADRILTIEVTRPSLEAALLALPTSTERMAAS